MYCELHEGNCSINLDDTSWHTVFKLQDNEFAQKTDGEIQNQQVFTDDNTQARLETSKLSPAEVSQTSSAASHATEPSSEIIQKNRLDSDYMSQAFNQESTNTFKRHGRAILTVAQVQAIFRYKSASFAKDSEKAGALARMYGVCVKTVRDIWGGRTWYRATFHLDQSKPFTPERLQKKAGRPKGAKDRKPRARKITFDGSGIDESYCHLESRCDSPSPCEDGAASCDWTDFPPATGEVAAGFEDPFEEDWNQWLREDSEGSWETESPAAFDDDD
jgi:hypothetical protein